MRRPMIRTSARPCQSVCRVAVSRGSIKRVRLEPLDLRLAQSSYGLPLRDNNGIGDSEEQEASQKNVG